MGTCSEEEGDGKDDAADLANISGETWELVHVERNGEKEVPEAPIHLEVKSDSLLKVHLKVNTCQGPLQKVEGGRIEIGGMSCTEACCDPDFAKELMREFSGSYSWSLEKEALELNKEGLGLRFEKGEKGEGMKE